MERETGIEEVGQARSIEEARRNARESIKDVDLAVVDLLLPDGFGVDFIRGVRRARVDLPVLVMTVSREKKAHD